MKKTRALVLALLLAVGLFAGCGAPQNTETSASAEGGASGETKVIKIGASPTPHAEILAVAKEILAKEGYDLQIQEFPDYVIPNTAVEDGDLDANYFQHKQYLENFNAERGTHLAIAAEVHYEPFGLYPGKTASIAELKDGAKIAVPNDTTNEARALMLLEAQGLIKLKDGAGINATKLDIVENPKNLDIVELEAAQLPRSLQDVDMAVINGNYSLQAGLSIAEDSIAHEEDDSAARETYVNVLCVKEGHENDEAIQALAKALKSDEVKKFMEEKYAGGVVPLF